MTVSPEDIDFPSMPGIDRTVAPVVVIVDRKVGPWIAGEGSASLRSLRRDEKEGGSLHFSGFCFCKLVGFLRAELVVIDSIIPRLPLICSRCRASAFPEIQPGCGESGFCNRTEHPFVRGVFRPDNKMIRPCESSASVTKELPLIIIIVVRQIVHGRHSELAKIPGTRNFLSFFSCGIQRRKQKSGKNRDDRNNDEKFYKGESSFSFPIRFPGVWTKHFTLSSGVAGCHFASSKNRAGPSGRRAVSISAVNTPSFPETVWRG